MKDIKSLKSYKIVTEKELPEVNGTGYILEHIKTKARVLIISNDDENKVFNIGFRTPPYDDSGIPHIIEHSVLCGSKKYPVKDPFVELAKGSLNTFLNAMTYSDKTVYPVASCNTTDFENLMKVYLDAVFYPNIYEKTEIMRQEGWHYELDSVDGELKYNGVVFNEMKGVYSSPEQLLNRLIEASLLKDTPYGKDSGGDPKYIPTLTQERFLDFHSKYYHPSNSYIYIYGDCDMEKELDYIDREYLSHYDYKFVDSEIGIQEPYDSIQEIDARYSVADNEDISRKTYIAYNHVVGRSVDKKMMTALSVLEYALMDAPGAPLKEALTNAGICEDSFSSFDNEIRQAIFAIIIKNSDPDKKDIFVKAVDDTIAELCGRNGKAPTLSHKSLEAAINNFEFKHKEGNFGRFPKGLMMGLDAFGTWLYDDAEALSVFEMNDVYTELKNEIDTGYFEELLWNTLGDNSFGTLIVLEPERGLAKKMDDDEKRELAEKKARFTEAELQEIITSTKELKRYQEIPSTREELMTVPLLNISDIEKKARKLKNDVTDIDGVTAVCHDIFTNGIGYLEFMFKTESLDVSLYPYATLLADVFKYVDTDKHSYGDLADEIDFHTGGIAFLTGIVPKVDNSAAVSYFAIKTKALYEKLDTAIDIVKEIIFGSKLDDKKRLKEIIAEEKAGLNSELTSSGHLTTATRAMSYISKYSAYKDMTEGIGYYNFLVDLDEHFDEKADELIEKFKAVLAEVLKKDRLIISYTGDKDISCLKDSITGFIGSISTEPSCDRTGDIETEIRNEGFKTASQVQYVALAGDFSKAGLTYTGALNVLQVIFSYDYLWINVRVKGGAYGSMCSFGRSGMSYLTSYRDPNLMSTYEIYKEAYKYVERFDADERDLTKYIIGAIAKLDAPMTPDSEGTFSFICYIAGLTDEMLQKERDEVLSVTNEKIRALAPYVKAVTDSGIICAIGGEDKIQEAGENFGNIVTDWKINR